MSDLKKAEISSTSSGAKSSLDLTINFNTLFGVLVTCLGAFLSGYSIGVVNIPESAIKACTINGVVSDVTWWGPFPNCLNAQPLEWGLMVGVMALGGGFGGLAASPLCDRFGRKNANLFNCFFYLAGYALLATTTTKAQFGIARFFIGVGCGIASSAVSNYIGETAPVKTRGAFGTMLQLTLVVGILFSQAISLAFMWLQGWRILFALPAIPIVAQIFLLPACVETPPYLVSRNKIEEARKSLAYLRRGYDIEEEFERILISQNKLEHSNPNSGSTTPLEPTKQPIEAPNNTESNERPLKVLMSAPHFKHFIICILIHAIQQLSGINGVIFYSTSIFEKTFGAANAPYITIGVACLNLVCTLISVILVDKCGRRFLLMLSCGGMSLMSILIVIGSVYSISLLVVICTLLFVAFFAVGLGPVPWMLMSEIFPTSILSLTSAASITVNFFCNFIIGLVFPQMLVSLENYTFIFFACITAVSFVFIFICLPETKGKTLAEVLQEAK
jgi:sugar porter (SP) family MFS transporter